MVEKLKPIWEARLRLQSDPKRVEKIVEAGTVRAKTVSAETLQEVKEAMKL